MSAVPHFDCGADVTLDAAIESACRSIAPHWPLERQVAVNPWWGWIDAPFDVAAEALRRLGGCRRALPAGYYRDAWQRGDISRESVGAALREQGSALTPESLLHAPDEDDGAARGAPLLSDGLDAERDLTHEPAWSDAVTLQLSQYCAAYFDRSQADWHPGSPHGLYGGWRAGVMRDHATALLMRAPQLRARAAQLPAAARPALAWLVAELGVPADAVADLLKAVLLRINGWAGWCACLRWEARLAGREDDTLVELLAARLAWEWLLDDGRRDADSRWARWRAAWTASREGERPPATGATVIWQRAQEIEYQTALARQLRAAAAHAAAGDAPAGPPSAHVVFCIDVRSERLRRALEAAAPAVATLGFAGFFGLPLRYTPLATDASRLQLPVLIAPTLTATDSSGDAAQDAALAARRRGRLRAAQALEPFARLPSGTFTLVETLGLGALAGLLRRSFARPASAGDRAGLAAAEAQRLRPRLEPPGSGAARAQIAESILRAMSLTAGFGRLLVLVGHGSQSANNPHAAALDCGACGGHSGAVNARVLAELLNDPAVRTALATRGIRIPSATVAIAGLHDTTTDEVTLFDADRVPASHAADLGRLRVALADAGRRVRAERAASLGLAALAADPSALLAALRRRARDWAQTRPEWGLAGNAAFIAAPRALTRGLDLVGRVFLHDYRWEEDRDGSVLELILTAPMIVAHWINMQYYASTVDPARYGSGNKVLHNVVGGGIGVFEGNSGDLRIGLPRQSVHDGSGWVHAPLRLAVYVDAPRAMIARVIAAHATVRQLVDHEWLYLLRMDDGSVERYLRGAWMAPAGGDAHAGADAA